MGKRVFSAIRQIQIETSETPSRPTQNGYYQGYSNRCWARGEREPLYTGSVSAATMEDSMEVLHTVVFLIEIATPGYILKSPSLLSLCTLKLIAALFAIAQLRNHLRCPLTASVVCIHSSFGAAIKNNKHPLQENGDSWRPLCEVQSSGLDR